MVPKKAEDEPRARLLKQLAARIGEETAVGDWHTVTQADIEKFADATHDHQWIHVDRERAADGPFGSTIAHGFMTLALIPGIGPEYDYPGLKMVINYGLDRVRFLSPVPAGSKVRVRRRIIGVGEASQGLRLTEEVTIDLQGSDRPACVAETVVLLVVPG